jgi:hypothetical protein
MDIKIHEGKKNLKILNRVSHSSLSGGHGIKFCNNKTKVNDCGCKRGQKYTFENMQSLHRAASPFHGSLSRTVHWALPNRENSGGDEQSD